MDVFLEQQPNDLAQYVLCLQWSMATLTLRVADVTRTATVEPIFSTVLMMLGLIASSGLVSTLLAIMVEMRMVRKEKARKLKRLRNTSSCT